MKFFLKISIFFLFLVLITGNIVVAELFSKKPEELWVKKVWLVYDPTIEYLIDNDDYFNNPTLNKELKIFTCYSAFEGDLLKNKSSIKGFQYILIENEGADDINETMKAILNKIIGYKKDTYILAQNAYRIKKSPENEVEKMLSIIIHPSFLGYYPVDSERYVLLSVSYESLLSMRVDELSKK